MKRVVCLLAGVVLCLFVLSSPFAATVAGHWEGPIKIPGMELKVLVDLSTKPDGSWSGTIDIPAQGAKGLPLEKVSFDGSAVAFTITGPPGEPTFKGTLSKDGATIKGTFAQSGQSFPFELARSGEARAGTTPSVEEALEGFDAFVNESLQKWSVAGAGVAIVRSGEPVLVKGYGYRDYEGKVPVTGNTEFAIGSSTKAFTTLVLGTLVEEGLIEWDKPVRTYLPSFTMHDEYASREMTPRDLVCHRSGLPRHDLMWYGSPFSRKELFDRLRYLEPNVSFRYEFQYQNLMFMTAGYLAGEVKGTTWEDLVRERIFKPLGMTNSTLSIDEMEKTPDFSYGYEKKKNEKTQKDEIKRMPFMRINAMGPAGSINSSAADMARWVAFQMGGGKAGDAQIVTPETIAELHRPVMVVQGGMFAQLLSQPEMPHMMYALGWFVQPYRGHEMIHHGGNIDGFSAFVAFMPNDNVGVVVLTNANGTALPEVIALTAFDRFLGAEKTDWNERFLAAWSQIEKGAEAAKQSEDITRKKGTRMSHPIDDYAGRYTNDAYGTIEIEKNGKALCAAYHGMTFDLDHWHYDVFRGGSGEAEGTKIAFLTNLNGDIDQVSIPLEPTVAAIVFTKEAPKEMFDPAFLSRFVGDYELMGMTAKVAMKGDNRLTVTVPGQPTYELEPYMGTEFKIASLDGYSVRFQVEKKNVTGLVFIQPNGSFPAKRKK
jgi:CubicO group peptidase (beta-lactamase class C family)